MLSIDPKSKKAISEFAEFLSEKELGEHYTQLVKERIRYDLYNHPLNGQTFADMQDIRNRAGKSKDWFENLIVAVINASRTADLEFSKEFTGDEFMDDPDDLFKKLNVSIEYSPIPSIPGASFSSQIKFESSEERIIELMNIQYYGGEWKVEGKDGEKKTYYINAKRGLDVTTRIERLISEAMSNYFLAKPIDKEIEDKFNEWKGGKKLDAIKKGSK